MLVSEILTFSDLSDEHLSYYQEFSPGMRFIRLGDLYSTIDRFP